MNTRSHRMLLRKEFPVLLTMLFGGLGAILAYIGTQVQSVPWLEYTEVSTREANTKTFEFVSLNRPMNRLEILFTTKPEESEIELSAKLAPIQGAYFTMVPGDVSGGPGYCYVTLPILPSGQPLRIDLRSEPALSQALDVALSMRDVEDIAAVDVVLRKRSPVTMLARYYLETLMWLALLFVISVMVYVAYLLGCFTRSNGSGKDSGATTQATASEPPSELKSQPNESAS